VVQIGDLQELDDSREGRREFLKALACGFLLGDNGPDNGRQGDDDEQGKGQPDRREERPDRVFRVLFLFLQPVVSARFIFFRSSSLPLFLSSCRGCGMPRSTLHPPFRLPSPD